MTKGTKEWAKENFNLFKGCKNNCRYCYAKKRAIRFGRKTEENWNKMILRRDPSYPANKKIMFPSTHDLFPEHIEEIKDAIENLLSRGNNILIVTKPRPVVIQEILDLLLCYYGNEERKRVEFRFTIGSEDDKTLRFWEPSAPSFAERIKACKIIDELNQNIGNTVFKYSISMEPLLTLWPERIIIKAPGASEYWLGKMNHINLNAPKTKNERYYFGIQRKINSRRFWHQLYMRLGHDPKIRWKDSVIPFINEVKNNKNLMSYLKKEEEK